MGKVLSVSLIALVFFWCTWFCFADNYAHSFLPEDELARMAGRWMVAFAFANPGWVVFIFLMVFAFGVGVDEQVLARQRAADAALLPYLMELKQREVNAEAELRRRVHAAAPIDIDLRITDEHHS